MGKNLVITSTNSLPKHYLLLTDNLLADNSDSCGELVFKRRNILNRRKSNTILTVFELWNSTHK